MSESGSDAPMLDPATDDRLRSTIAREANPREYARLLLQALPAPKADLLKGLQGLQVDIDTLLQEQLQALEDVQRDFSRRLKPLLDKRRALISGDEEPTKELIDKAVVDTRAEVGNAESDAANAGDTLFQARQELAAKTASAIGAAPGIPHFWLGTLRACGPIGERISERDEEILKHLLDVTSIVLEKPRLGFALRFVFGPNDAIESATVVRKGVQMPAEREISPCPPAENAFKQLVDAGPAPLEELLKDIVVPEGGCVLVRTVYFEADTDGDAIVCSIDGTDITWKADKNPTVEMREKKQYRQNKGGKGRQMRVVKFEAPVPSFFRMFGSLADSIDEDEDEESALEREFDVARMIRSTIIPRAIEWFTGRVAAGEMGGDDEEDEEDGGMDMAQLQQAMAQSSRGPRAPEAKGGEGPKPDCKQQ